MLLLCSCFPQGSALGCWAFLVARFLTTFFLGSSRGLEFPETAEEKCERLLGAESVLEITDDLVVGAETFAEEATGLLFCGAPILDFEELCDEILCASEVATTLEPLEPNSEVVESLEPDCKALSKSKPTRAPESSLLFFVGFFESF